MYFLMRSDLMRSFFPFYSQNFSESHLDGAYKKCGGARDEARDGHSVNSSFVPSTSDPLQLNCISPSTYLLIILRTVYFCKDILRLEAGEVLLSADAATMRDPQIRSAPLSAYGGKSV
jgi:hypothetical protein